MDKSLLALLGDAILRTIQNLWQTQTSNANNYLLVNTKNSGQNRENKN